MDLICQKALFFIKSITIPFLWERWPFLQDLAKNWMLFVSCVLFCKMPWYACNLLNQSHSAYFFLFVDYYQGSKRSWLWSDSTGTLFDTSTVDGYRLTARCPSVLSRSSSLLRHSPEDGWNSSAIPGLEPSRGDRFLNATWPHFRSWKSILPSTYQWRIASLSHDQFRITILTPE